MGTHVFFEKDETATPDPLYSQCQSSYKFASKTNKILKMNRVILKDQQKLADEEDAEIDEEIVKDLSNLTMSRTYEEALGLFLPPGKDPPRQMGKDEDISGNSTILPIPSESSTHLLSLSESSNQLAESPTK
jgi:hypothetical protein